MDKGLVSARNIGLSFSKYLNYIIGDHFGICVSVQYKAVN